jgi:predicted Zn-dependent peptidase
LTSFRVSSEQAFELEPLRVRLGSGLRVIALRMPRLHRVVLGVHLRTGPCFEAESSNGISHFLEHMLFRGTARHPSAHLQALAFEALGGTLQGATSTDNGSLSISVPAEGFEEALALLGETTTSPVFSAIEVERGIVREEILEGLSEDGSLVEPETLTRRLAFDAHGLGQSVLGPAAHLERFDQAALHAHHQAHYTSDNCILCVAGPIDPEAVAKQVERAFSGLSRGALPESSAPPEQAETRFSYVRHKTSQTALRLGFRAPKEGEPLEAACDMLLRILDDGLSTRLYHRICDAQGLCYDASASYEVYQHAGFVEFAADATHERCAQVAREILALAEELKQAPPTKEELEKARRRFRWQLDVLLDEPEAAAEFFGLSELSREPETPAQRLERMFAVTGEDIQRAAEYVFDRRRLSAVAVGLLNKRQERELAALVMG